MKVFLRYEDNEEGSTHKTLKMTLPKSWKTGPTSRLLNQFVESYNGGKEGQLNILDVESLHLSIRIHSKSDGNGDNATELKNLPSNGIVVELISDREDVYICHGPSRTREEIDAERQAQIHNEKEAVKHLSKCVRFGCQKRFPKGGPYPECKHHTAPPVFHETAKFWSCCPDKKAYDWEDFQRLPTCRTGICTDVKDEGSAGQKQFLGGCDVREKLPGPKLKSIEDFNSSSAAGGSAGAPVLERLRNVLEEVGVENELFDQVFEGIQKDVSQKTGAAVDDAGVLDEVMDILGGKLKRSMKAIAVEQLRIS